VISETPRKKLFPVEEDQQSSLHATIFAVFFKTYYGQFNQNRVFTENLFEEPKRAGVEKFRLVDLLQELGFTCEKGLSESNRVCSKCSTKITPNNGI